jgi:hypothetical protein
MKAFTPRSPWLPEKKKFTNRLRELVILSHTFSYFLTLSHFLVFLKIGKKFAIFFYYFKSVHFTGKVLLETGVKTFQNLI